MMARDDVVAPREVALEGLPLCALLPAAEAAAAADVIARGRIGCEYAASCAMTRSSAVELVGAATSCDAS